VTFDPGGWSGQKGQRVLHLMGHRPSCPDLAGLGSETGCWIVFVPPFWNIFLDLEDPCEIVSFEILGWRFEIQHPRALRPYLHYSHQSQWYHWCDLSAVAGENFWLEYCGRLRGLNAATGSNFMKGGDKVHVIV
jgi:hypothetical protein